jgi:hypothetical protein
MKMKPERLFLYNDDYRSTLLDISRHLTAGFSVPCQSNEVQQKMSQLKLAAQEGNGSGRYYNATYPPSL